MARAKQYVDRVNIIKRIKLGSNYLLDATNPKM
jgi:hypothetical protein